MTVCQSCFPQCTEWSMGFKIRQIIYLDIQIKKKAECKRMIVKALMALTLSLKIWVSQYLAGDKVPQLVLCDVRQLK